MVPSSDSTKEPGGWPPRPHAPAQFLWARIPEIAEGCQSALGRIRRARAPCPAFAARVIIPGVQRAEREALVTAPQHIRRVLLFWLALLLGACSAGANPTPTPTAPPAAS